VKSREYIDDDGYKYLVSDEMYPQHEGYYIVAKIDESGAFEILHDGEDFTSLCSWLDNYSEKRRLKTVPIYEQLSLF